MGFIGKKVGFFVKGSILMCLSCAIACGLSAQTLIKGKLVDATTKEAVPGVTIKLKGKKVYTVSGSDGSFAIKADTKDSLELTGIGYLRKTISSDLSMAPIELVTNRTTLDEVTIFDNKAIERSTPIAASTVGQAQIEDFSANREFPELLAGMPSVYTSKSGGGAGDSKIFIRGFGQQYIAVMVNGVPINDMENGAVYWSDWAGLMEIANSVQVQRGLGASKLSIQAIGGNINIITNAAEMRPALIVTSDVANDHFFKNRLWVSTGEDKNGFAFSGLISATSSAGYVAGTASQAYNYFGTISYKINKKSSLAVTVTGSPQWHNERGAELPYETFFGNPHDSTVKNRGSKYNDSWGYYHGQQFSFNKNFYHKPVANVNYYLKINSKTKLSAVAYASVATGGGTTYLGKINGQGAFSSKLEDANGLIRVDDIEKWNSGIAVTDFGSPAANTPWTVGQAYAGQYVGTSSKGIVRSSKMDNHNWYGSIINLENKTTKHLTLDGGIDLRTYKGFHYERLENALGLNDYYDTYNANNPQQYVPSGDKDIHIDYDYQSQVQQYGGFLSAQYELKRLTAFAVLTASNTSYQKFDKFDYLITNPAIKSPKYNFFGDITKGGLSYKLDGHNFAFANVGYFEKAPFFTSVFPYNYNTQEVVGIKDEKILGVEAGYGYTSSFLSLKLNVYYTKWKNRYLNISVTDAVTGNTDYAAVNGLIEEHKGVELEAVSRVNRKLELLGMGSVGDFRYKNNVTANVFDASGHFIENAYVYADNLRVGTAAQTTGMIEARYEIIRGLKLRASYHYYANIYATFNLSPTKTASTTPPEQAWMLPNYGLVDAGLTYSFRFEGRRVMLKLNIDNLFNKIYIAEAANTYYNPSDPKDFRIGNNGSGETATVYPGFGLTWSAALKISL